MVMDMDGKIDSAKFVTQSHCSSSEMRAELDLMFLLCDGNMAFYFFFEEGSYASSIKIYGSKYNS